MPLLEGVNVGFRPFPGTGPDDGAPLLMHLKHMLLGPVVIKAEDFLENEDDVGHQVDRVIQHDHLPDAGKPR